MNALANCAISSSPRASSRWVKSPSPSAISRMAATACLSGVLINRVVIQAIPPPTSKPINNRMVTKLVVDSV